MTMEATDKSENPFAAPQADAGPLPHQAELPSQICQYAKYEDRFNGWVIDRIISFVLSIVVSLGTVFAIAAFVFPFVGPHIPRVSRYILFPADVLYLIMVGTFFLTPWLYYALLESGPRQATPGKRLFKTKVTDLAGNRISFARASARYFSKYLSFYLLLTGYLAQPFKPKKQALHDVLAGTLVIKVEPG